MTEDDAQNGPDHVDAHRTLALVVSPWTRRGAVDSTHYDTASMIATMEDLLHLPAMTITDQRATRMWADFARRPDLTPYAAQAAGRRALRRSGLPEEPGDRADGRPSGRLGSEDAEAAPRSR